MKENALLLPVPCPTISALLSRHRAALSIVTGVAGIASAWAAGSPLALLATVSALLPHTPPRGLLPSLVAVAVVFAVALIARAAPEWLAFLGLSLGLLATSLPRSAAEAARQRRERELEQLIDAAPSHLWRLTPEGEPVFFSRRMVDFLGFDASATDRPGISRLDVLVVDAVHPADARAFSEALRQSLASGMPFAMRYRLRRADGAWRWMSSRAEPLRDETGAIVQWFGVCHEIDDQVRAEDSLRRSEHRLRQMIDTMPALIWCMRPDGTPSYLNRRLGAFLGLELADLTAPDGVRSLADIHPRIRTPSAQLSRARSNRACPS